ncbi:hypothetical protein QEJ31_13645 [Pigmentibacter sp. JX0631]|uniref:hypothetical protein n=1 Tax=Pigmentibacter sp. JX0631 TaxID=2976982 RepID=UPI002468CE41|nr:hypothetical protein [Pigmentibacter sp. JX0631]WGL59569.1 hypothetical protein QEJ31_13645 [Pigmentibacter sp. JX0631]
MVFNSISDKLIPIQIKGVGKVGCAVLKNLNKNEFKVTEASDSKSTISDPTGLNISEILNIKEHEKKNLNVYISSNNFYDFLDTANRPNIIIDSQETKLLNSHNNYNFYEKILRENNKVIFSARDTLFYGIDILLTEYSKNIGINAALNGIGRYLQSNLELLRNKCLSFSANCHPVSTFLIELIEKGESLENAINFGKEKRIFEYSIEDELIAKNAFISINIAANAIFGYKYDSSIFLQNLKEIDPDLIRYRKAKGKTTRLICSAQAEGAIHLSYLEIEEHSPLYCSSDCVSYSFNLGREKTHVVRGNGVGPLQTALAIFEDLNYLKNI